VLLASALPIGAMRGFTSDPVEFRALWPGLAKRCDLLSADACRPIWLGLRYFHSGAVRFGGLLDEGVRRYVFPESIRRPTLFIGRLNAV
jgi:hypothetical protein